tara:strand:+ start:416 stop:553 length:138 start_codon:yes stop_codon:yes gene_type:complete
LGLVPENKRSALFRLSGSVLVLSVNEKKKPTKIVGFLVFVKRPLF